MFVGPIIVPLQICLQLNTSMTHIGQKMIYYLKYKTEITLF